MRVVAFAYSDSIPRLSPLYRGLAEDLVVNVNSVMPGVPIYHVRDDKTEPIPGAHTLLVSSDVPLMTWHMKAHREAQALGEEVLFTEPDVRFKADVLDVFDDPEFDVAVTEREVDSTWDLNGTKVLLSAVAPYTLGTTFSRSRQFWDDVTAHCMTLPAKEQNWIGDMLALWAVMQTGKYRVKVIPGPIYNHIPCSREDACEVKVLHFKGMRKEWLFHGAREAA